MRFFELPEPEPRKTQRRRRLRRNDDWQAPSTMMPGYLGEDFVLASNDEVAVVVQGVACYPTGFAFVLHTVTRYEVDPDDALHEMMMWPHGRGPQTGDVPPTRLRFGIAFSNGEKATTLDSHPLRRPDDGGAAEPRPHLTPQGGGGGGGDWHQEIWVWPLPPSGPVTFACEWPAFGIDETLHELGGDRFHQAAERAVPIF